MNKPIPRQMQGFLADYPYAAWVSTAPESVGFTDERAAAILCRLLGSGAALYVVLTRAEWGRVPALSMKAHLAMDLAAGVTALAAPWLMGFTGNTRARNTFLVMAAAGLLGGLLTQPDEMPAITRWLISTVRNTPRRLSSACASTSTVKDESSASGLIAFRVNRVKISSGVPADARIAELVREAQVFIMIEPPHNQRFG